MSTVYVLLICTLVVLTDIVAMLFSEHSLYTQFQVRVSSLCVSSPPQDAILASTPLEGMLGFVPIQNH